MTGIETVGGRRLLFVMATQDEYGPHLRRLIRPMISGVGPVEGAASVAAGLAAAPEPVDLVVSLGSAGSRSLEHAAVYQIASVAYRDMDASVLGFPRGVTPLLGGPATVPLPFRIDGVATASISTGGAVISGPAYDGIEADMVDMESYAVYRAAARFGAPLVGLRGISDGRSPLTGLSDWTDYLHILDEKLAAVLETLPQHVARWFAVNTWEGGASTGQDRSL